MIEVLCICVNYANLGEISGLLDLPYRTMLLSWTLDAGERVTVARDLLRRAGIAQDDDSDTIRCDCGNIVPIPETPALPAPRTPLDVPVGNMPAMT